MGHKGPIPHSDRETFMTIDSVPESYTCCDPTVGVVVRVEFRIRIRSGVIAHHASGVTAHHASGVIAHHASGVRRHSTSCVTARS